MNTSKIMIKTENLILKPITLDHKEDIFREFTSEITTYTYPKPPDKIDDTIDFIKSSMKNNEEGHNLQTVVLKKGTEEFLGCAELHNIDKDTPELGIWIKKSAHGHGYGREAITALKAWADKNLEYRYLLYPVAEENHPSRRIPESLGGEVCCEYDEVSMSGVEHHILEYRIYPGDKISR